MHFKVIDMKILDEDKPESQKKVINFELHIKTSLKSLISMSDEALLSPTL